MLIVDSQIHLWQNGRMSAHHRQIPTYSVDDALAEMKSAGVDCAVIHPPSSLGEPVNVLAVDAVRKHPSKFCILGHFDLQSPDKEKIVANWRQRPGMLGFRYTFNLPNQNISALIQILQAEGLATILAQPKLLAMSGQNAVFQVGGEIPIRIATGFATDIQFKPFGTIVNFVARVSEEGDILLTVTPEVSEPDFSSPVEGIPSFRTRRASTATRLRNGQTLMIGGLLQHARAENVSGVPYLQDIPYVGYLFRHTVYSSAVTELVVVVTPRLVTPQPPGTEFALPTDRGPLTNEEVRTKANPYETTRPRIPGVP